MIKDEAWQAARAKGIGGSDAGAVLGVSSFKSPLTLWKEKRGEIPQEDIETRSVVLWGNLLEDVVAKQYAATTGRQVVAAKSISVHPLYPWMICNIDRFAYGPGVDIILEIKTVAPWAFSRGEWGPDGSSLVPPTYYAQAQHNLAVTGKMQCDMPVLIGGSDYRVFHLPRDEDFIAELIRREKAFWESLITGVEPEPINLDDLAILFPNHKPGLNKDGSGEAGAAWAESLTLKRQITNAKKLVEAKEFLIKSEMGEAETLTVNGVKIATWKRDKNGARRFKLHDAGVFSEDDE